MNNEEKIEQLRSAIDQQLAPLLSSKVALFGLPNHGNIGDTLITMGELELFQKYGTTLVYEKLVIDSSDFPDYLDDDCSIFLQGGGDFGDVWRGTQDFRISIIKKYREHPIVMFPQTVFYESRELMMQDAHDLANHPNLTLCARDHISYEILKANFRNNVLLVPDMAFYMNPNSLRKYMRDSHSPILLMQREDKERAGNVLPPLENAAVSDWPTFLYNSTRLRHNLKLVGYTDAFYLRKMKMCTQLMRKITLWHLHKILFPSLVKKGVEFLSQYNTVYLTRLHAAILCVLIRKEFYLLDNSYHKNMNFYNTWLSDLDNAHFIS